MDKIIPSILTINLTKIFKNFFTRKKNTILEKINLKVNIGTIHGFIGPNGAGKTTTIKILISSVLATYGKAYIKDKLVGTKLANKLIGYVPENTFFPNLSLFKYLKMMGEISNVNKKELNDLIKKWLMRFNLWEKKNDKPNIFSSGMKKKVLFIQALLHDPEILILDEPTANLDPSTRIEIFDILKELKNNKKTIFISSHILSELEQIADEITILNKGKIIYNENIKSINDCLNYKINTDNNVKLKLILKENKWNFIEKDNEIIIVINKDEIEKKMILFNNLLRDNKINILILEENKINLNEIYKEWVINEKK